MVLKDVLRRELCFAHLSAADNEDILRQLARQLYAQGLVNEGFEDNVITREHNYPTGLPVECEYKVAIPHTDVQYVLHDRVCVATLNEPVTFECMGDPDTKLSVKTVIMMAIKEKDQQLPVLKQLINLVVRNSELINRLGDAADGDAIYDAMLSVLPEDE